VLNYLYIFLLDQTPPSNTKLVCYLRAGNCVIGGILTFFVKEELRRLSSLLDISITSGINPQKVVYK
jgi:hypothetical protein